VKIAFQVEDISDQGILSTFVKRIGSLNAVEPVGRLRRRAGGCSGVFNTIAAVAWSAWHDGAEMLIVAVDNDDVVPAHNTTHAAARGVFAQQGCHHCKINELLPLNLPAPLKTIIAVPVQAIEAWLLFGAEIVGRRREHSPEGLPKAVLKQKLYGSTYLIREDRLAICLPIAESVNMDSLASNSPSFKIFRDEILTALNP
jgi:hypothetical protein